MADRPGNSTDLSSRVRDALERDDLLSGVRALLVACSGGSDSVALLELLVLEAEERGLRLVVAHFDHGQRGEESAEDAAFVRDLSGRHGLEIIVERDDGAPQGLAEQELRHRRHAFLTRAAAAASADAVALGHTLDDQAETVIFNLARGAARPGLAGMRPRRTVDGLLLLRPLLRIRRHELREFLVETGTRWRDDPSNEELGFTRNLLRHRIVKELEGAVPGAVANIGRAADLLQLEEAWIAGIVRDAWNAAVTEEQPGRMIGLDIEYLRAAPRALQTRLVREALSRLRGSLRGLSREHVDGVLDEVLSGSRKARDLPGARVRTVGGTLQFLPLRGRRLQQPGAPTER